MINAVRILVTGPPGVGKTTLVRRVIDYVKAHGVECYGFITDEVRERGVRVGFKITDVNTSRWDWLAHVDLFQGGPRVGKYNVNVNAMVNVGVPSILSAKPGSLLIIDEIGKMELVVGGLIEAIENVINRVHLLGTVYEGYRYDSRILGFIKHYGVKVMEISRNNRDSALTIVINELSKALNILS